MPSTFLSSCLCPFSQRAHRRAPALKAVARAPWAQRRRASVSPEGFAGRFRRKASPEIVRRKLHFRPNSCPALEHELSALRPESDAQRHGAHNSDAQRNYGIVGCPCGDIRKRCHGKRYADVGERCHWKRYAEVRERRGSWKSARAGPGNRHYPRRRVRR